VEQAQPQGEEFVHVVSGDSPHVQDCVLSITSLLASWAYDVTVVGPLEKEFRVALGRAAIPSVEVAFPGSTSPAGQLSAARGLASVLADRKISLIHAHGLQAAFSALLARRVLTRNPPIVCTPHGLPPLFSQTAWAPWRRQAYRWLLRHCDAVIATSYVQRRQIATIDARTAQQTAVVPYGIDPQGHYDPLTIGRRRQLLGISPAAAVVGCVGETVWGGPMELFVEAAARVSRRLPNVEFAVIGNGPDQDHFRDLAHQRGLLGATVFVPERKDLPQVLGALNVLVVPQAGWPAGMLALQALTRGVGVVAVAGSEVEEMLPDAGRVTIVSSSDADALADGIHQQLEIEPDPMPQAQVADAAPMSLEQSSFLVSRQFYDLDKSWVSTPQSEADNDSGARNDLLDAFGVTEMARNTVAVYHRVLDLKSAQ